MFPYGINTFFWYKYLGRPKLYTMATRLQGKILQIITNYYFHTFDIKLMVISLKAATLGLTTSRRAGYVRNYSLIFLDTALMTIQVMPDPKNPEAHL